MKRCLLLLVLLALLCSNASALEWLSDLPTALARAQQENKTVLLDFTGSDWCPWCQKLKAEVFDHPDFAAYAAANLVLVEVDFPHLKPLSLEQANANSALAAKYHIRGYPTVLLLKADGQVLGKTGYVRGGPTAFLARIEKLRSTPPPGEPPVASPATAPEQPLRPSSPKPAPAVLVAPPPLKYGALAFKGVSGVGSHRLALINNQSLMAGETAKVKTFDTNVVVTVKEIRATSVVIIVAGQTQELSLAHPPAKP